MNHKTKISISIPILKDFFRSNQLQKMYYVLIDSYHTSFLHKLLIGLKYEFHYKFCFNHFGYDEINSASQGHVNWHIHVEGTKNGYYVGWTTNISQSGYDANFPQGSMKPPPQSCGICSRRLIFFVQGEFCFFNDILLQYVSLNMCAFIILPLD